MNKIRWAAASACLVTVYSQSADLPQPETAPVTPMMSGIETQYIDNTVRAQDNFYQYVNGKWLASTEIPPDKGRYGSFDKLNDDTQDQLRSVVEGLQKSVDAADPDQRKIADLYGSFMDEAALERLGLKPLNGRVREHCCAEGQGTNPLADRALQPYRRDAPYTPVGASGRARTRPSTYSIWRQDGLGMPDRDYYLQNDEQAEADARAQYREHIEKMLTLAGDKAALPGCQDILALETALAKCSGRRSKTAIR